MQVKRGWTGIEQGHLGDLARVEIVIDEEHEASMRFGHRGSLRQRRRHGGRFTPADPPVPTWFTVRGIFSRSSRFTSGQSRAAGDTASSSRAGGGGAATEAATRRSAWAPMVRR